jgi:uncharacterized protein (TIGR03083 family)
LRIGLGIMATMTADAFAPLTPAASLAHLEQAVSAFDAVLAAGDFAAPVPSCPGWTLLDLTHHVGGVHRWAAAAITEKRAMNDDEIVIPDTAGTRAWFLDGATALVNVLRTTPPETECWAFGPKPRLAAFWFRRQPLETAVHAWDAAGSQGLEPHPFDIALALDGIDEVRHMFFPRQIHLGRIEPLTRSLAIAPDETSTSWVFPAGDSPDAAPEAVVSGPADVLYLLLWGRVTLDDPRVRVAGDEEAAGAVLAARITP